MGKKHSKQLTAEELEDYINTIMKSTQPLMEIIEEARPGKKDYDFESRKLIAEGGQGVVF